MEETNILKEPVKPQARTDWAEQYVEMLVSMPFISEFVFRSPKRHKKGREIADLLISQGETNIVFSQKCQLDPTSKSVEKNALWVLKSTKIGLSQLQGGLKTFTTEGFWCDHPKRGRVKFSAPLSKIDEAIVLVETRISVDLNTESGAFPLTHSGIPITYLSVDDFLFLVNELRTVPELLWYLKERRALVEADLKVIGDEKNLFPVYILNDRHFDGCTTRADAKKILHLEEKRVTAAIKFKKSNDIYCELLERVAYELSVRDPNLPKELEAYYEPAQNRNGYLKMQLAIADLDLPERMYLGQAFAGILDKLANSGRTGSDLVFGAFHSSSKPDWVFVFCSAQNMDRKALIDALSELGHGALANYDKTKCLVVADRDGKSFEVLYLSRTSELTDYQKLMGQAHFAKLKMSSRKLSLHPEEEVNRH